MKNFTALYLIIFFLNIEIKTNAQLVTISALNQIPVAGNVVHYADANTFGFDPIGTGPVTAKVWNNSGLFDAGTTKDFFYVNPNTIPASLGSSLFPTANIARGESGAAGYFYYQNTANDIRRQGWYESNSNFGIYKNNTVAREFHFPITAGQTFTSTYNGNYAPFNLGEDSTKIEQGSVSINADMQGQMILPNGTYNNTLRLHVIESFNIVVYFSGIPFLLSTVSDDYYYWFVNNVSQPILIFGTTSTDGNPQATVLRYQYFPPSNLTLNLKVFIEGYYSGNGLMNNSGSGGLLYSVTPQISINPSDVDTVFISLMNAASPHNQIAREYGILKTNGNVSATFGSPIASGNSYYIRVEHRNSISVWSSSPVLMSATTNYNFTTSQSKAYGNNMIDIGLSFGESAGTVWGIFSGDISDEQYGIGGIPGIQDGIIASGDYGDMETSTYSTQLGYVIADITGDGIVESADYGLMESSLYYTRRILRP